MFRLVLSCCTPHLVLLCATTMARTRAQLEAMVNAHCAICQAAKAAKKKCNETTTKETKKKSKVAFEINGHRRSLRLFVKAYKKGMLQVPQQDKDTITDKFL